MRIAVLFDGAGLARLGLEQAGHECVGYEIDPIKHEMSKHVGKGNVVLADVTDFSSSHYLEYDAIWMSPPCQAHSIALNPMYTAEEKEAHFLASGGHLLAWSLELSKEFTKVGKPSWVENVLTGGLSCEADGWGTRYNAYQFSDLQRRRRLIGGNHIPPHTIRNFAFDYPTVRDRVPPAVLASEWKDMYTKSDKVHRSFTKWYRKYHGRNPNMFDAAKAQGFDIPSAWLSDSYYEVLGLTRIQTRNKIVEVIGNGVPVYMARAFGECYTS